MPAGRPRERSHAAAFPGSANGAPASVAAAYGFDRAIGFFVEVYQGGAPVAAYDRLNPPYDDLNGALRFLVAQGFLDPFDLDEAIRLGGALLSEEMEPGPRRAAEVMDRFRRAAD